MNKEINAGCLCLLWVPVSIKPLLLVRQFGNSKILAFHMNSMHSILCLNLLSIWSHPEGPVVPIDVTLHEKASSKSLPNLKAEAVSVYIIQVTQQISELHRKAQVGSESHSHAHPDKTLRNQSAFCNNYPRTCQNPCRMPLGARTRALSYCST